MSERDSPAGAAGLYERSVRALPAATQAVRVSSCPVCDFEQAHPRFEVEGVTSPVVACDRCGLGRFEPEPDAESVRAFYPDEYYGEPGTKFQPLVESLVRLVASRHIAFLSSGLAPGGRVLDVGCGRGVILGELANRGFEVHGVEISAEAARGADPRAEIRIAPRVADAGYPDSHFDQVIIWHVLEHLPDLRGTLREVHRVLKPGGRLIVAVPNFSSLQARWTGAAWFHLDLPRHLYHFPLSALRRLMGRSGFAVDSEHHFSLRQNPFGWIQSLMNQLSSLPRNGLYELLHRRGSGEPAPFDAATRARLWLGLVILVPLGIVLTAAGTLLRSGATVHVVARRFPDGGSPHGDGGETDSR